MDHARSEDLVDRHGGSQLLCADEVAEWLQVSTAWFYAATRRNRLPHVRLGRYVRYRGHAIDAWLEGTERTPPRSR